MLEANFTPLNYARPLEFYRELRGELGALYDDIWFTNLANASAAINANLPDLNWVGFYLLIGSELRLGPFQGRPACLRIPLGKGVCGTAAKNNVSLVVPDVHLFPGHIACDVRSRSELVVPMRFGERTLGVLDLDSPLPDRFTETDRVELEKLIAELVARTVWPSNF